MSGSTDPQAEKTPTPQPKKTDARAELRRLWLAVKQAREGKRLNAAGAQKALVGIAVELDKAREVSQLRFPADL